MSLRINSDVNGTTLLLRPVSKLQHRTYDIYVYELLLKIQEGLMKQNVEIKTLEYC